MAVLNYLFGADFRCSDVMGNAITGGYLEVYYEGDSGAEKCITYKDFEGNVNPFRIPIPMDGMPIIIVDTEKVYRVHCYNLLGMQVWSRYNVRVSDAQAVTAGDCITVESGLGDNKNIAKVSVTDNSIGRDQLKNPRPFIPDSAYLQFLTFDSNIVVTLSEKLKEWLEQQGFVADE